MGLGRGHGSILVYKLNFKEICVGTKVDGALDVILLKFSDGECNLLSQFD